MIKDFISIIKQNKADWENLNDSSNEMYIPAKTILLQEGEISKHMLFIKNGCLRQSFNKDGRDITFQFFFEQQAVSSFDSFINNQASAFSIESLEPSLLIRIEKTKFDYYIKTYPEIKDVVFKLMVDRFRNYTQLFLSRIKDSPQERYEDLLQHHPEIIQRIPQHYIASYLGITSVSLSRIRNRQ